MPRLTRTEWIEIGALVTTAIALRAIYITGSLDYDETQHFSVANAADWREFLWEMLPKAHPPLAYLPIVPFIRLSAHGLAVKSHALLSGVLAVPVSYVVFRRLGAGRWVPCIGAFVVATLPAVITQSVEARGYSLALLFVWLSIGAALRLQDERFEKTATHAVLALWHFLALMTVYSAVFHVAALSAVVYAPFVVDSIRHRRWGRLTSALTPHLVAAVVVVAFFRWHFAGQLPVYGHTSVYSYSGSLADLPQVAEFLVTRLQGFCGGFLPAPWSALPAALVVAALVMRPRSAAERTRMFAGFAAVAVGGLCLAALRGSFPLGGAARHNIAVYPGIVVATVLGAAALLARFPGRTLRVALLGVFAVGVLVGLLHMRPVRPADGSVIDLRQSVISGRAGLVTDWRARMVLNWFAFRDIQPHTIALSSRQLTFDYRSFQLVQVNRPSGADVTTCLRLRDSCWIAIAHFSSENLLPIERSLVAALGNHPGLRIAESRVESIGLPTLLIRVVGDPTSAGDGASSTRVGTSGSP